MGKNKRRNKWAAQPRRQQNPLAQPQQQFAAPRKCREYWQNNLTEEERKIFSSPMAVIQHAGVSERLGSILAAFYRLHSVQSLLFAEVQNIVEDWGLFVKGVQPAINSLLQSEDKFYDVMRKLVNTDRDGARENYAHDVDALFDRITRWEGIPKTWEPGDSLRLDGGGRISDVVRSVRGGTLNLKEQDMEPEPLAEATVMYAIAEMDEQEESTIIRQDIARKGTAASMMNRLARKNRDKMYVLFEQREQKQTACHMTPLKVAQMPPGDEAELVEIDIRPKQKKEQKKEPKQKEQEGGKPKEKTE